MSGHCDLKFTLENHVIGSSDNCQTREAAQLAQAQLASLVLMV